MAIETGTVVDLRGPHVFGRYTVIMVQSDRYKLESVGGKILYISKTLLPHKVRIVSPLESLAEQIK